MFDPKEIFRAAADVIHPPEPPAVRPPLTLREAAEAVGCSPQTLRRAIWAGELQCLRAGREIRIRRQDLGAYLRREVSSPASGRK